MKSNFGVDINRDYGRVMNYDDVDRFILKILWWHCAATALLAFANSVLQIAASFPSPFAWRVIGGLEAAMATGVGLSAAAGPALLRTRLRDHYAWRVLVTVALTTYSYLFVFLSGGSIEMHFHFFMVLALLVVYYDWRLGWLVVVLTAVHHGVLNYVAPGWVYFYGRNDLAVIAHALPVIATAIFTSLLCANNRRSLVALEDTRQTLERRLGEMTALHEISQSLSSLADVGETYGRLTQKVADLVGARRALIALYDPERKKVVGQRPGHGVSDGLIQEIGSVGEVALQVGNVRKGGSVIVNSFEDLPHALRVFVERHRLQSVAAVPLSVEGRILGILYVADKPGGFAKDDVQLLEVFAGQAAVVIQNARLFEEATNIKDQLVQAQKMEAVGRLAGGVAHDFNNLLTVVTGRSLLLLARVPAESPLRRDIELIQDTAERAATLTRQLLAFSRKQILAPKLLDLNAVVPGMTSMLRRLIAEHIELSFHPGPEIGRVKADPGQLEQVVLNLVVNARDAMPEGGRITIETADVDLDERYARQHVSARPGPYVMLAVSDTGIGMDADTQAHIFEPFFTTKEEGKGTGLGLATVYGIVKQSGGNIWVYSEPGHGTTFKIYLPRVEDAAHAEEPVGGASALPKRGSETILLVEDEEGVRTLVQEILETYGYTVAVATQPAHAIRIAEQHPGPIHLLLTDVVMPQMNGPALAERLVARRPTMRVLYLSGYTHEAAGRHGLLAEGTALVQKPFAPRALAHKVREILDGAWTAESRPTNTRLARPRTGLSSDPPSMAAVASLASLDI